MNCAEFGVRVMSLNDPEFRPETVAGVYMNAITLAKNEAYSREVAFHTRKGCRSNVQTRDLETGWCYRTAANHCSRLPVGAASSRRGETRQAFGEIHLGARQCPGRQLHEWARYLLLELAGKGASLTGARLLQPFPASLDAASDSWGISTWNALLQPSVFAVLRLWRVERT